MRKLAWVENTCITGEIFLSIPFFALPFTCVCALLVANAPLILTCNRETLPPLRWSRSAFGGRSAASPCGVWTHSRSWCAQPAGRSGRRWGWRGSLGAGETRTGTLLRSGRRTWGGEGSLWWGGVHRYSAMEWTHWYSSQSLALFRIHWHLQTVMTDKAVR